MPTQFSFTYTIPAGLLSEPFTAYDGFAVNLANTMQNVQVTSAPVASNGQVSAFDPWHLLNRLAKSDLFGRVFGIESALAAVNASVTVFVSFPGDPDVCNSPTQLGPYFFSGDVDMQPTSDAPTATAADAAAGINIVTAGVFELCFVISPLPIPADAYLTVGEVEVEAIPCEESPPADADVLGDWSGTYTCTNFGTSDDVMLPVALNIAKNQDGSFRYTDDGGATYDGHFCGSSCRYNGGVANSYTESGLFIYVGAGSATKKSVWNSVPAGASGGNCYDDLTKD